MKFIHTGDIHYGMKPDSNRPWGKERADAVKSSLQKIIDVAKKKEVDLLLIAGDLFHSQPFSRDLKEVNFLFSTIPDTKVVIIAGNHDCLRENNNILSFPWAKNVVYLSTPTISSVYFQDINTEIYGFSYHDREVKENIVSGLSIRENDRVKILLLHGGDATHLPFDKNELKVPTSDEDLSLCGNKLFICDFFEEQSRWEDLLYVIKYLLEDNSTKEELIEMFANKIKLKIDSKIESLLNLDSGIYSFINIEFGNVPIDLYTDDQILSQIRNLKKCFNFSTIENIKKITSEEQFKRFMNLLSQI